MRCPRCRFEGEQNDSICPNCGSLFVKISGKLQNPGASKGRPSSDGLQSSSGLMELQSSPLRAHSDPLRTPSVPLRALSNPSRPLSLYTAKKDDFLNQGRYRLVDQLILPDNQRGQGAAWLAVDMASQTQVVLREVVVPPEEQANKRQLVRAVTLRFSNASQHNGFPKVLDVFNEQNATFLVLQHIDGESLASLLKRQGGALSERIVVEYGRQLCEMLAVLEAQQPPVVHGAINPETVIISPDRTSVHLIHLPLLPPKEVFGSGATDYKAPEQIHGTIDKATDLYTAAATLHHAVTGFDPRERVAFFYPPARRLNPAVSPHMEAILSHELRLSVPQRYARAANMQADLSALLTASTPEIEQSSVKNTTGSFDREIEEVRRRSQRRTSKQLSIFVSICLLALLCLIFFLVIYPLLKAPANQAASAPGSLATQTALQSALYNEWKAEDPTYQMHQIGLSDGRYIFDTYAGLTDTEINYKKQGAQALFNYNQSAALRSYQQAVTYDQTDAEAQIYYQDLQITAQKVPYVTIVLGLSLMNDPLDLATSRADLRAAFAFQNDVNAHNLLPNRLKLRIMLANSGNSESNVATVAQFVARHVQIGNQEHILAVVGWPSSGASAVAVPILAGQHIPVVAQTSASNVLDGISSFFFRINPDDAAQGQAQGDFAFSELNARKVLVLRDVNDSSSSALADAFTKNFQLAGGTIVSLPADNFTERTTTVEQYIQTVVRSAYNNQVDLIFLPGVDQDAIRLASAIGRAAAVYPYAQHATYMANLKVLSGDAVDTSLILGQGDGPDAQLAQGFPQDMQRLVFTSFADPQEWSGQPASRQPALFAEWNKVYGGTTPANPHGLVPALTSDALLTNDAFGVIAYALQSMPVSSFSGAALRDALAAIGTGNVQSYQGVTGPIEFGDSGNPIGKPILLLGVVPGRTTGTNVLKLIATTSQVTP